LPSKGTQWGAPRWVYFDTPGTSPVVDLEAIADSLRRRLAGRDRRALDERAVETLNGFLRALAQAERQLLPRKKQVALAEMRDVLRAYERQATGKPDTERLEVVRAALQLLEPPAFTALEGLVDLSEDRAEVDLGGLSDHWLVLIHPVWQAHLKHGHGSKLLRLRDLRSTLKREPLSTDQVPTLVKEARWVRPVDERVVSAIVGVIDE
jgi:hypothetical protein